MFVHPPEHRIASVTQAADTQRTAYDLICKLREDVHKAKSADLRIRLAGALERLSAVWQDANAAYRAAKHPHNSPRGSKANGNGSSRATPSAGPVFSAPTATAVESQGNSDSQQSRTPEKAESCGVAPLSSAVTPLSQPEIPKSGDTTSQPS